MLEVEDFLVSHEKFSIKECDNCRFRYTDNPPSEQEAGAYYEDEDYVEHSDKQEGLIFKLYHIGRKWMLNRKLRLIQKHTKEGRILDVGSASGYFMNHMKSAGYGVDGIEISPKARELCKSKFDINAYEPKSLINKELDSKYDIISLWHVFEHVYTYNEYFEAFEHFLKDDGRLLIAMPNHKCLDSEYYGKYWCAYDVPRHLWHFEPKTFETFVRKRGFRLEAIKRMPLDPFYNAMVSASYKKSFTFLPWTLYIGLLSYVQSLFNKKRSSSIIYVLKKNI
ncbi:MAG: class I SAM-dependent methyltransferase [Bacteroidia bacterium]